MDIPPVVQRYQSYVIALDYLFCQDYEYYCFIRKNDPNLKVPIKTFVHAMKNLYQDIRKDYSVKELLEFETPGFEKALTRGWFG